MAGLGYKSFSAGDVLTAAQVQGYLQDQAVMRFADSTARASAIGTANFTEGMISYLDNTNQVEYYSGSTWASIAPVSTQGLTLLNTTSFSGVSSQSINDVFSATYTSYKVLIRLSAASALTNVFLRYRVSGADNSTGNYFYMANYDNYTSGTTPFTAASATQFNLYQRNTSVQSSNDLTFNNPFVSEKKTIIGTAFSENNSVGFGGGWAGFFNATTSFTGFSLIGESGTLTGNLAVYGFNV
jgi:hypothetical protein